MYDGTHTESHTDKHTQRHIHTHTSTLCEEVQCELCIQEQRESGKVTKVHQTQRTKTLNMTD